MTTQRNYSKAALVLAIGAFLISAGNAGAPALAKAMAGNSDTVDGFDAVKSSTSVKQRKGKLVATSSKNGRLPNNIIKVAPNAKKLGGHRSSYYLAKAAAAAQYETAAHAFSTFQTKEDAAASQNQAYWLTLKPDPQVPTSLAQYLAVSKSTLTLPTAGKVRIDRPQPADVVPGGQRGRHVAHRRRRLRARHVLRSFVEGVQSTAVASAGVKRPTRCQQAPTRWSCARMPSRQQRLDVDRLAVPDRSGVAA